MDAGWIATYIVVMETGLEWYEMDLEEAATLEDPGRWADRDR